MGGGVESLRDNYLPAAGYTHLSQQGVGHRAWQLGAHRVGVLAGA